MTDAQKSSDRGNQEALLQFSPTESAAFRTCFAKFDAEIWDRQFEQDVAEGRFDSLANEAVRDLQQGRSTDL